MPFNGAGVFVRLTNWTNDANNNLPISATKFDLSDNDIASGLTLCLTRDGQGVPSTPLTWTQALTINLAADGAPFKAGRTGGTNNPQLQLALADATGGQLNLTTAQTLGLAIQGTNIISMTATGVTIAQPLAAALQLANGIVGTPALSFASETNSGLYRVGAGDLGLAVLGAETLDIQAHQLAVLGPAATSATFAVGGNGVSIANAFQIVYGAAGGVTLNLAGAAVGTISSAGAWSFPAATAAVTATINGAANQYAEQITASATSGQSFGLFMRAGTTAADTALLINNQANSTTYLALFGNGECYINLNQNPLFSAAVPSGCTSVGYLDMPLNNLGGSTYTIALTDRGKLLDLPTTTITIPANASVAFPVGTTIILYNGNGASVALNITTDTLKWLPSNATGNRTLAAAAVATLYKITSTSWLVWGFGIS